MDSNYVSKGSKAQYARGFAEATYTKLVALVQDATQKNESIATLHENVGKLGGSAVALLNDMAKMAAKVV